MKIYYRTSKTNITDCMFRQIENKSLVIKLILYFDTVNSL